MTDMLPCLCPSCKCRLDVKSLSCGCCNTEVTGIYKLPVLAQLPPDDQQFVISFVKSSGSLKEMSAQLKLSYPTVRNMLNDIIEKLDSYEQ